MKQRCIECKREIPVGGQTWSLATKKGIGPGCFYCAVSYLKRSINDKHRMPFLGSIADEIWDDPVDYKGVLWALEGAKSGRTR